MAGLANDALSKVMAPREAALAVVRRLRGAGHVAYFAGGCVRDQLMGRPPKDYDVATDAEPVTVRRLFSNTQAVGAAFGVILVRLGGEQIEVATFRADGDYVDGRRPESVRFVSAEQDAQRRDFTINGLFFDPEENKVIDFVGGQADLAAKRLRAIGEADKRFAEDHLRLLRAVRFAARFGLAVEPTTADAIRRHAGELRRIAPERVGEEIRRMLAAPTRQAAWVLLRQLQLLPEVFRFERKVPYPEVFVVDKLSRDSAGVSVPLALAAVILEECMTVAEPLAALEPRSVLQAATAVREGLRLSNDEFEALVELLTGVAGLVGAVEPSLAKQRRFLGSPGGADGMALLETLREAGVFSGRLAWLMPRLRALESQDNAPPPLLTGDDLVAAGRRPGRAFKALLATTYDAQLEGRLAGKAEALAFALSMPTD